jgi:hypothetical protein
MGMNYPTSTGTSSPMSSPAIVTSSSDVQTQLLQAMMSNIKDPNQQASLQAALALQAQKMANRLYMGRTIRKLSPALTNGVPTQAYAVNTPFTFNLSTSLNGYCEGIIVRVVLNYNLAAGTAAVYGLTGSGKMGIIDTVEVRYNKSQIKIRPVDLRELSLAGALDEWVIPNQVLVGQQDATIQAYLNPTMPVATGAQTTNLEFFLPFNLISPKDPRGLLPLMAGDTGLQVLINTPVALLAPGDGANTGDSLLNAIYPISGTGHAISAITGTIQVDAVFRDGDTFTQTAKMPFNIALLEGTFQAQIDQVLAPLVANTIQLTKLNIMGRHYYVLLKVIDALQPTSFATQANIAVIMASKDAAGGNVFFKYGTQTNMSVYDYQFITRFGKSQDLDPGCFLMVEAPTDSAGTAFSPLREGDGYLDNTRTGWADWRYGVNATTVGVLGSGPRIEPTCFYVNPTGLVPV